MLRTAHRPKRPGRRGIGSSSKQETWPHKGLTTAETALRLPPQGGDPPPSTLESQKTRWVRGARLITGSHGPRKPVP
jgi:hypothetical protein